jgi:hypothetical protein
MWGIDGKKEAFANPAVDGGIEASWCARV